MSGGGVSLPSTPVTAAADKTADSLLELRRSVRGVYESVFDQYREEWNALKMRVDIAERRAEKAERIADSVLVTLRAFAKRRVR